MIDDNNSIEIGSNNGWDEGVKLIPEEGTTIIIGSECLFAKGVVIRTSDGHSILSSDKTCRINPAKNIEVGRHCWVGEDAMILKGVKLPEDCVIGARSILTNRHYEPNSLYVGTPARRVKSDISWFTKRI